MKASMKKLLPKQMAEPGVRLEHLEFVIEGDRFQWVLQADSE